MNWYLLYFVTGFGFFYYLLFHAEPTPGKDPVKAERERLKIIGMLRANPPMGVLAVFVLSAFWLPIVLFGLIKKDCNGNG